MAVRSQFASSRDELAYIEQDATAHGVDPYAALAVASVEGGSLPAAVGDDGTSFGPWQLHAGGALPASVWARGAPFAREWADSPAGLDYAVQGLAAASGGLRGDAAIAAIVRRFERPADPDGEIGRAQARYHAMTPGELTYGVPNSATAQPVVLGIPGPGKIIGGAAGAIGDIGKAIAAPFVGVYNLITSANTWIRVAFFLAGLVLVVLGLKSAIG